MTSVHSSLVSPENLRYTWFRSVFQDHAGSFSVPLVGFVLLLFLSEDVVDQELTFKVLTFRPPCIWRRVGLCNACPPWRNGRLFALSASRRLSQTLCVAVLQKEQCMHTETLAFSSPTEVAV